MPLFDESIFTKEIALEICKDLVGYSEIKSTRKLTVETDHFSSDASTQ